MNILRERYWTKKLHVSLLILIKEIMMPTELSEIILKRKDNYHRQLSHKLNDPETSAKAYWSILKTLYNGKKIPLISPILVNNKLYQILRRKQAILMFSSHLNILQL